MTIRPNDYVTAEWRQLANEVRAKAARCRMLGFPVAADEFYAMANRCEQIIEGVSEHALTPRRVPLTRLPWWTEPEGACEHRVYGRDPVDGRDALVAAFETEDDARYVVHIANGARVETQRGWAA